MNTRIDDQALKQLFLEARTHNEWQDQPVSEETLRQLHDLLRMGPTSANCCPARFIFVQSMKAKQRLEPCLDKGNREKTMAAPVTVIIANDMEFHEHMGQLFPHTNARPWFAGKPEKIADTAARNGTLQGAYLIMAARALGLDCGPMSGFNPEKIDAAFYPGKPWRANFLVNLGYGKAEALFPRSPRFEFDEVCTIE